jgi:hypothetical protein
MQDVQQKVCAVSRLVLLPVAAASTASKLQGSQLVRGRERRARTPYLQLTRKKGPQLQCIRA